MPRLCTPLARAYIEHKMLLFRNQHPSPEAYATFARQWGEPRYERFAEVWVPGFDDMAEIGNVGGVDDINTTEAYRNSAAAWHTDCAAEVEPNAATEGGETTIADSQAAYDALDEATRNEIDGLTAYHCYSGTRKVIGGREEWEHIPPLTEATEKQLPAPIARPVARSHSVSGRKGLYSPAGSIIRIEGMDHARAHDLMRRLKLHAIDDAFCYTHRYRPGDILMWDNTATMHCAKPIDGRITTPVPTVMALVWWRNALTPIMISTAGGSLTKPSGNQMESRCISSARLANSGTGISS